MTQRVQRTPTCGGSNVPEDCYTIGDEDNDGFADCDDPDCGGEQICLSTTEIECQDGVDNDSDGFFDCLDGECRNPIGVPLMMDQATDDWLQPDTSCYQSLGIYKPMIFSLVRTPLKMVVSDTLPMHQKSTPSSYR